jgi:hypothetical protein
MSKRIVVYLALFNVIMLLAIIFSNIYMWGYLNTEINEESGNKGQGSFVIPYIFESGFQVIIGHVYWADNGTIVNLGPIPTGIPNYPFILSLMSIMGNFTLIALVIRKQIKEQHKENTS